MTGLRGIETVTGPTAATFGQASIAWLDRQHRRQLINDLTHEKYGYHLKSFGRYVGSEMLLNEITNDDFDGWLTTAKGRDGAKPRPRTLRTKMIPLRKFFEWATEQGLTETDPTRRVKNPRDHRMVPRRLPAEVCAKLLHVADFRQTTVVMLGLHLGLRACEMSRANIQDWDRANETLLVHGKGGKERVLPVIGEMALALEMWVEDLGVRRGPLFPAQASGDRISPSWVGQLVTSAARTARVNATAHMLRHSCASDLVARGVPMPVIQQVLGHSSLATTTRYVVASADELREHIGGRDYRTGLVV